MDRLTTRLYSATAFALVALIAVTSATLLTLASPTGANDMPEMVKLERVVIEGRSASATARVEQLPRVIVVGQRQGDQQLARARVSTSGV